MDPHSILEDGVMPWERPEEPYDRSLARYKRDAPASECPELCEVCRTIDFGAFRTIGLQDESKEASYLGWEVFAFPPNWQLDTERCPVCRLFRSTLVSWEKAQPEKLRVRIRGLDGPEGFQLRLSVHLQCSLAEDEFQIFPESQTLETGILYPLRTEGADAHHVDYAWLNEALRERPAGSRYPETHSEEILEFPNFRLLDCDTLVITNAKLTDAYIALSYVVGPTPIDLISRSGDDGPLNLDELPKTIRDAVIFTQRAGVRYLWVDALCITEPVGLERKAQLDRMADIYAASWATLVALGRDCSCPIPGVTVDRKRPLAHLSYGGLLSQSAYEFGKDMAQSSHDQRCWTFQEVFLSKRLVYPLERELLVINAHTYRFEGWSEGLWLQVFDYDLRGVDTLARGVTRSVFAKHFQEYCRRKLTREEDALDAFRGYLNSLPWPSLWGIVCCSDDTPHQGDFLSAFCVNLLWESDPLDRWSFSNDPTIKRLPDAPTWSWAACRVHSTYLIGMSGGHCLAEVAMIHPDGTEVDCNTFFSASPTSRLMSENVRQLSITAPMLTFRPADNFPTHDILEGSDCILLSRETEQQMRDVLDCQDLKGDCPPCKCRLLVRYSRDACLGIIKPFSKARRPSMAPAYTALMLGVGLGSIMSLDSGTCYGLVVEQVGGQSWQRTGILKVEFPRQDCGQEIIRRLPRTTIILS